MLLDFNILEIADDFFETIKDTAVSTYETIKTETINLFNGTTFKKIFSSSDDEDSQLTPNDESIESLAKRIEELKKTIEYSKKYIGAIIEKIREKGKIKIVNKLNGNPRHPEYQSSFPDLLTPTPKSNNANNFSPLKAFDEPFDIDEKKDIKNIDKNFKRSVNQNFEEYYSNDFADNNTWTVSDRLNSFYNIRSTIKTFQKKYEYLKSSHHLDNAFMTDSNPFLLVVNNNLISIDDRNKMLEDFKKIIPNIEYQKLISTYANQKFLYQSYLQFISEHPELDQYKIKNPRNIYKINLLNDGAIKIVATNLSDLDVNHDNSIQKYTSLGIRATIVLPPNDSPIMKYSYFLK